MKTVPAVQTTTVREIKVTHLDTEELAKRYRMNANSIRNWRVRKYGPPYIKVGKIVLYPIPELEKWERDQIVQCTAQTGRR